MGKQVKIYVHTPFKLHHEGEHKTFPRGNHSVDEDVAGHWYVKAHTGEEPSGADADTTAAADALLAELDVKAKDLAEREKALADRESELAAKEEDFKKREAALAEREKAADKAAKK